ncbi:MAG TPA: hypothetical protein VE053_01565 [Allosphingosinicella sp.]|nr:hypothetical protein [Allosphingosinicella sp.]
MTVPVAPWAIAGIRLGMNPREVAGAMKAAGYKLHGRYTGRSWQAEFADQVSFLRGIRIPPGPETIRKEDYKKGQETIQVIYAVDPAGPYAVGVTYRIAAAAIDADRFEAAALSRYGRPSRKRDTEILYCSAGEPECVSPSSLVAKNQLPNLAIFVADGMKRSLELRQGRRADLAFEAEIKAEVERLYPKRDKPSF